MFTQNTFATTLIIITLLAVLLGLSGIWAPKMFTPEFKWKLIWTFVTISVGVSVISYVFQYLNK